MKIISRAEWGARMPKSSPTAVPLGSRRATCVHHDGATPITVRTLADAYALMRRDQAFHMDGRGWNDIGYNYLVISAPGQPVDGAVLSGRGRDVLGAHCEGYNTEWIGVQVAVGGAQAPSPAALASTRWLHDSFEVAAGHSLDMKGHSDGFATACPGRELLAWVRAGMPARAVAGSPPAAPRRPTQLAVDGQLGASTRRRLQQWAGTPVDGALGKASWAAVQRKLGVRVDGDPGPKTWAALQRLVGARPDGAPGPLTYRALQTYLNKH